MTWCLSVEGWIRSGIRFCQRSNQEKEIKQNKQPNNGQCCLFIVGVSTGFGHAMTFFKMKNKCQVVLKYKKTDRLGHVIMIVR